MQIERLALRSLDSLPGASRAPDAFQRAFEKPKSEEPPPPPPITEADVKAAEEAGYRKGFLEGEKEGKALLEGEQMRTQRELTQALAPLVQQVKKLVADYNQFIAKQKLLLPPIALAIARKIAGDAIKENPTPVVERLVAACVETVLGAPQITVTVNARLSSALEEQLMALFANRQENSEVIILGDPEMEITDCRVEWKHGCAERSTSALWEQIEQLIEGMVEASTHEPPALPEVETPPEGDTP